QASQFFPHFLALLFGGEVIKPVGKPLAKQFNQEIPMMEALAAEGSDEGPDNGAVSGSGD
ncbi:hypothetical protein B0H11DRAFT_1728386, partial [Mycena galericulata]